MVPLKIFREPDGRDLSVSGTNTYYSLAFGADADIWSVHFEHGAVSGTLTLQATNKPNPDLTTDADWVTVTPDAAPVNPAGTAGSTFAEHAAAGFYQYRWKYTNSTGSGLLAAWYHGKPRR